MEGVRRTSSHGIRGQKIREGGLGVGTRACNCYILNLCPSRRTILKACIVTAPCPNNCLPRSAIRCVNLESIDVNFICCDNLEDIAR